MDWGRKWPVDFNAGKTQLVLFDWSNNTGTIDVKVDGSVLEEKSSFKILGLTFFCKLYWGSYIISVAKTASKKMGALVVVQSSFLLMPCMEYSCHVWAGAPSCYLELLDKLQKWICGTVGLSQAASLEPLAHRQSAANKYFFVGIALVDVHLNWLNWSDFLILEGGLLIILIDCMVFLLPFVDFLRLSMSTAVFAQKGVRLHAHVSAHAQSNLHIQRFGHSKIL